MKDIIFFPITVSTLAQVTLPYDINNFESLGINGFILAVTVFIWRHFTGREAKAAEAAAAEKARHEAADIAERNRLLILQNELQAQVVALLLQQSDATEEFTKRLLAGKVHAIIDNPKANPVNTKNMEQ